MPHAVRSLLRTPGFTLTALLTLALGLGVNTAMFSMLNAVLFETAYPASDQLIRIFRTTPQSRTSSHPPANYFDHRAQNSVFSHLAAFDWQTLNLAQPGQPAERLRGLAVSGDYFALFGLQPELGRWIAADDDQPGKSDVLVLSHSAWQQRFGGDPAIVGRQLRIDGAPVTVIGVAPASFHHAMIWGNLEAWRPLALSPAARQNRAGSYLSVVGRLKPGITLEHAQAEVHAIGANLVAAYPDFNAGTGFHLVPLARAGLGDLHTQLSWFVVALAGFVLLIACANLANLQFARHSARVRDQAIRSALGASRWRLMREILTESLLLAFAGGALGLLVAVWCTDLLSRRLTLAGPQIAVSLDLVALGFAFCASLLTGLAFGILPAWFASRPDVSEALKQGARQATASRAHHRLRQTLIVGEVALALVLLAGAGFFLRGLERFLDRDPAWRTEGLLTGHIDLRGNTYTTDTRLRTFHERLLEKLAALPGVERAALGSSLPTWGFSWRAPFVVEGRPEPARGHAPLGTVAHVTPDYFAALGLPLLQGRAFTASDDADSPDVVIINGSLARTLWPGENPVGKRLGDSLPFMDSPREIVGVVRDAAAAGYLGSPETRFQMYRPLAQSPTSSFALALRTSHDPAALAREVRLAVAALDPDLPVNDLRPVRTAIARYLGPLKIAGQLLAGFALLGVLLAAVGIYGVISGFVVQRTGEIGIRVALGAQIRDILQLVLGHGLRLTLLGAALGLAGAFALSRLLQAIVPALPPADLLTTAVITFALLSVALVACYLPARRATKVSPLTALRSE